MTGIWKLFGLRFASELPLPDYCAAAEGRPDVYVSFRSLPQLEVLCAPSPGELQFEVAGVGRFRVANGREIIIDPATGAQERELCVFLLGSAVGALLHQRGLFPLHANAVVVAGQTVAFVGTSGAGKSTLAAWFESKGVPVLADDVAAIQLEQTSMPMVLQGVGRLRLWKDALDLLGRQSSGLTRSFAGQDKYDLPMPRNAAPAAAPLAACYFLGEPEGDEKPGVERIFGVEAVAALTANTYRGAFIPLLNRSREHLAQCVRLAREVPIFRVRRHKDRARFQAAAGELWDHAAAVTAGEYMGA